MDLLKLIRSSQVDLDHLANDVAVKKNFSKLLCLGAEFLSLEDKDNLRLQITKCGIPAELTESDSGLLEVACAIAHCVVCNE